MTSQKIPLTAQAKQEDNSSADKRVLELIEEIKHLKATNERQHQKHKKVWLEIEQLKKEKQEDYKLLEEAEKLISNHLIKIGEIRIEHEHALREQAKEIREWVYDNFRLRASIEEFDEFVLAFDKKFLEKTK